MTLKEYFGLREQWLREHRHPKTVNETRVAVEAFCEWLGSDPDIDIITPNLVEEWAADKSHRRRQLVSNLCGLLRLYDAHSFPRRGKQLVANAPFKPPTAATASANGQPETMVQFARLYVSRRILSDGYANILVRRVEKISEWARKSAIKDLCNEALLNAFLEAIEGQGSAYTIRKYRQDFLTLWSAAADDNLCDYPVRRRIRRLQVTPVLVECYTLDEARALVVAAEQLKGAFDNGVARRLYWPAVIRFGWDTGLRRADCWRWERSCLQPDGTFRVVQHKTRKPIRRMLRPETIEAIDKIDLPKPLDWTMQESAFGFQFQRIIAAAELDRGSFKWLRRSAGSHVEAAHPGAGHRALGNTTQVFGAHYDAQVAGEVLLPPAL